MVTSIHVAHLQSRKRMRRDMHCDEKVIGEKAVGKECWGDSFSKTVLFNQCSLVPAVQWCVLSSGDWCLVGMPDAQWCLLHIV